MQMMLTMIAAGFERPWNVRMMLERQGEEGASPRRKGF